MLCTILACREATAPGLGSVRIAAATTSLTAIGATLELRGSAFDSRGAPLAGQMFAWQSGNPSVATVTTADSIVTVTAVSNGSAKIYAAVGDRRDSVTITVSQAVTTIVLRPEAFTFTALGQRIRIAAEALDANSHPIPATSFVWSSSNPAAVALTEPGVTTSVANGSSDVSASAGGTSAAITLVVAQVVSVIEIAPPGPFTLSPGETQTLTVVGKDANGFATPSSLIQLASLDETIASVTQDGVVTAVGARLGTVRITATSAHTSSHRDFSVLVTFAALSAAHVHTCGLTTTGAGYCWGVNLGGQFGNGGTNGFNNEAQSRVVGGHAFKSLMSGWDVDRAQSAHTCALTTAGDPYCWGVNDLGELGAESNEFCNGAVFRCSKSPIAVAGSLVVSTLSTRGEHTCGLTGAGGAYCWGANGDGQLGDGTTMNRSAPVAVQGSPIFSSVTAGMFHSCGVMADGTAQCWGANWGGQLGDGTTTPRTSPTAVTGGLEFVLASAGGGAHMCALTSTSAAYCWGANDLGQLGAATTEICPGVSLPLACSTSPIPVSGGQTWEVIAVGAAHSCGIVTGGAAYCWGYNFDGQLGVGDQANRSAPTLVAGGLAFRSLSLGLRHTCGVTTESVAYCWGDNGYLQLGVGSSSAGSPTPRRINGQR